MGEKEAFVNKKWMKEQNEAVDTYRKLEKQLKALIKAEKDEFDEGEELRERLAKLWFHLPGEERRRINNNVKLPKVSKLKLSRKNTRLLAEQITIPNLVGEVIKLTTIPRENSKM